MKKILVTILMAMTLVFGMIGSAGATSYTFQPNDPGAPDLWDLSHGEYYTWGIDWTLPEGETVTSITLFFDDIRNWKKESNDLYVHLLESVTTGAHRYNDPVNGDYDQFTGQGTLLNHWEDLGTTAQDITYQFTVTEIGALLLYSQDGNFGLGFDPDCHFYNNGISLNIQTSAAPVPEPATMLLLGTGLAGLAGFRKRLTKKQPK